MDNVKWTMCLHFQYRQITSTGQNIRMELKKYAKQPLPEHLSHRFIEPPPMLAERTCAKLWKTLDMEERNYMNEQDHMEEQDYTPNSGTFLDSTFFSPESVLPAAFLLAASEPDEKEPEKPKAVKIETDAAASQRSAPWIGLIASVSVGIVVAVFLFPMIEFAKRSTQSYVAENWTNEITRRVGQYEQIHANQGNTPQIEEVLPYNLALSSWQELRVKNLPSARPDKPFFMGAVNAPLTPFEAVIERVVGHQYIPSDRGVIRQPVPFLEDFAEWNAPIPFSLPDMNKLDMSSMADSMLLVTPGQNNSVRSAFGQNILLRDGRVFFRVLPGMEAAK